MQRLADLPPEEAIPSLGEWLFKLSLRSTTVGGERKWTVHAAAQKALLAIPGHAEWYRDDVVSRFDFWERTEGHYGWYGSHWNAFTKHRNLCFSILKEMPSPETVRVLGEMLGDEEDGYEKEKNPDRNLDFWAAGALSALGIESPPIPLENPDYWRYGDPARLKAWRLWYGPVKAGNRTFRFEGDPQVYDLNGPVREVRDTSQRPRQSGSPSPAGTVGEDNRRSFPWVPLGVACVVLVLAVSHWLRGRRKQEV